MSKSGESSTPLMQQYREVKARHPDMLLFFHMGDFYELFNEDAELAARLLGLTLTSRDKVIPMAGIPVKALDGYLRRLLKAGQRVAICDQVEDAALAKGLVKREVTRIVTPGTLTEEGLLEPGRANYLVAVVSAGSRAGLAWVDPSTGAFWAYDIAADRLVDEVSRLAAVECLFPESLSGLLQASLVQRNPTTSFTSRPDWTFDTVSARKALLHHFGITTLAGFGFDDAQTCLTAAGAVVTYLRETLKSSLGHLGRLRPFRSEQHLFLDEVTRRSLELTHRLRDGEREGSLLSVLDRTVTPMGARLLQDWLVAPLCERTAIEARLDAVGELLAQPNSRADLRALLADTYDLQRLTARVSTGRASPRDLVGIAKTLGLLPKVLACLATWQSQLVRSLAGRLELCPELHSTLTTALQDEVPLSAKEGGVIRTGFNAELDELREISKGGKEWLARYQADEITRSGIPSLKVGFNSVHGYYIEITHTHGNKVPSDYQRRQTLKNAERYVTPELKAYEEKVLTAEEKSQQLEYSLFTQLREQVAEQTSRLLQTADVLAQLDVLVSLAEVASSRQYVRPILRDEPTLLVKNGRHPVLDQLMQAGTFVPNDTHLHEQAGLLHLVTGPNMAGKSTFLRQVALLTLLAHLGSFVPAESAEIGLTDRIFTRVGASDELSRGQSTFMVEMTEAANILNNATARSLVILDEIGRGTSTYDGVSLAWAITEYLHDVLGCRALFATHYHELAQLEEKLSKLRNYNVLVRETGDEIVFLHKIERGSASKSYGIHVAQLAGVPDLVLERAQEVLAELENHPVQTRDRLSTKKRRRELNVQPLLFGDFMDNESP